MKKIVNSIELGDLEPGESITLILGPIERVVKNEDKRKQDS